MGQDIYYLVIIMVEDKALKKPCDACGYFNDIDARRCSRCGNCLEC